MIKELKKLLTSNKNIKFDNDYVKSMTSANTEKIKKYNFYSSCIQGLQNSFCDLFTLYNKVFEEVIENIKEPTYINAEEIINPDTQQYIANVIKAIFKTQVYDPLYANICSIEKQIENINEKEKDDPFITETLMKMITNVRFNMEEFDMFLDVKPFGLIDFEFEDGFEGMNGAE